MACSLRHNDKAAGEGRRRETRSSSCNFPDNNALFRTFSLYVAHLTLGLSSPVLGTTVVHLEWLFDVDSASTSFIFTLQAVGMIVGTLLCGAIYDRVIRFRDLLLSLCLVLLGAGVAISPLIGELGGLRAFIAVTFAWSIPRGYVVSCTSSYLVNIWNGYKLRQPAIQACHAVWSLGATVGPFIISSLLVDLPTTAVSTVTTPSFINITDDYEATGSLAAATASDASIQEMFELADNTTTSRTVQGLVSTVRYAYIVSGSVFVVPSILFLTAFCRTSLRPPPPPQQQQQQQQQQQKQQQCYSVENDAKTETKSAEKANDDVRQLASSTNSREKQSDDNKTRPRQGRYLYVYVSYSVIIFLFNVADYFVEQTWMSYLTSFAVKYLGWSLPLGSAVLSVYYGCHFGGRVLGVPLSSYLKPRTMLICNVTIATVACVVLLSVDLWPTVLWICSALAGFALSSVFASAVLLVSDRIEVTGRVSAVISCGMTVGCMVSPLVVGQLFDSVTPVSFVYFLVASVFSLVVLLVALLAFGSRYGRDLMEGADDVVVDVVSSTTTSSSDGSSWSSADSVDTGMTTYF